MNDRPITESSATRVLEVSVPHGPLVASPDRGAQRKKPVGSPAVVTPAKRPQALSLRDQPLENYSDDDVRSMLREKDFFDSYWNKQGKGPKHDYEMIEQNGEKLVRDHATALVWQQGGPKEWLAYDAAEEYIQNCNRNKFAGHDGWRLPTLEEAMSLMESTRKNGDLFIDPAFDREQRWIWTADKQASGVAWYVSFNNGDCLNDYLNGNFFVRVVRSGQ